MKMKLLFSLLVFNTFFIVEAQQKNQNELINQSILLYYFNTNEIKVSFPNQINIQNERIKITLANKNKYLSRTCSVSNGIIFIDSFEYFNNGNNEYEMSTKIHFEYDTINKTIKKWINAAWGDSLGFIYSKYDKNNKIVFVQTKFFEGYTVNEMKANCYKIFYNSNNNLIEKIIGFNAQNTEVENYKLDFENNSNDSIISIRSMDRLILSVKNKYDTLQIKNFIYENNELFYEYTDEYTNGKILTYSNSKSNDFNKEIDKMELELTDLKTNIKLCERYEYKTYPRDYDFYKIITSKTLTDIKNSYNIKYFRNNKLEIEIESY